MNRVTNSALAFLLFLILPPQDISASSPIAVDSSEYLLGKLLNTEAEPGEYTMRVDFSSLQNGKLPGGVYICKLITPEFTAATKMVYVK